MILPDMSDPATPGPFIRGEAIERASGMITFVITTWYKAHRHLVKVNLLEQSLIFIGGNKSVFFFLFALRVTTSLGALSPMTSLTRPRMHLGFVVFLVAYYS